MRTRIALAALLIAVAPALAQEEGQTPGAIPDPSTYQGSMQLQQQEQQQQQQNEQQNQQMQQRLDQTYQQNAPRSGGGAASAGGGAAASWWRLPPLPAAKNPLLGRWRQAPPGNAGLIASLLSGSCESIFGKGVVAFEPGKFQWVARDGHEELLNTVSYRSDGRRIAMLTHDAGAIPVLVFSFPSRDRAVVAPFGCAMDRVGSAVQTAATAQRPSGPANSQLKFQVGIATPGYFTPLPRVTFWLTAMKPDDALTRAGVARSGGSLGERLVADCRSAANCVRDWQAMTAGAVAELHTDVAGHAQTGSIQAGRYYVVGYTPYQGRRLLWDRPVDVQRGANVVTLDQTNADMP